MKRITSFRVIASDQEKELFYIIEKTNGGLTLIPRHLTYYRDDPTDADQNPYLENRFSIHVSPNNPDGSLIHRTTITQKRAVESYIWTDAIKRNTGFTPIYYKLCCDLQSGFACRPHNKIVNVGAYDPSLFVLYYAVLVSAPGTKFYGWRSHSLNVEQTMSYSFENSQTFYVVDTTFNQFRITLLVGYLECSSDKTEHVCHHTTMRPDDPVLTAQQSVFMSALIKGIPEQLVAWMFQNRRAYLVDKLVASKIGWSDIDREKLKAHLWRSVPNPVGHRLTGTLGLPSNS